MTIFKILFFLFAIASGCTGKHDYTIEQKNIKSIEICKHEEFVYRQIPIEHYSKFVQQWNNAKAVGPTKYIPQYHIKLTLQNDSFLHFRTSGASIKLNSDYTYQVDDKELFYKLYNQLF